jgi:hypothetical protein
MSIHSSWRRTFVAISGAIAMCTLAVGAAIGPAQAAGVAAQVTADA